MVRAKLSERGVRWALVPTWMHDKVAQEIARKFAVRLLDEMLLEPPSIFSAGLVHLLDRCPLLDLARDLLRSAPYAAARVAAWLYPAVPYIDLVRHLAVGGDEQ